MMRKIYIFVLLLLICFFMVSLEVNAYIDTGFTEDAIVPPDEDIVYEDAEIGKVYDYYSRVRAKFANIAVTSLDFDEVGSEQRLAKIESTGEEIYEEYAPYTFHLFKVNAIFNMPYESQFIGLFNPGGEVSLSYGETIGMTYNEGISTSLSTNIGINKELGIEIGPLSIGTGSNIEISTAISNYVEIGQTFEGSKQISLTFVANEPGYYMLQKRANFNMYIVVSFEKIFDVIENERFDGSVEYIYLEKYKAIGINYHFTLIKDLGFSFTRYLLLDNGVDMYYADQKMNDFIYF